MKWNKWDELSEKTSELSLRERGILVSVAVVLVLLIWFQFVYAPIEKSQVRHTQALASLNQQISSQSERQAELINLLAHKPNEPLWQEQKRLQGKMSELRKQIEGRLSNLIAPEQMVDVMRTVLSDYKGLRLLRAKNLPVEPLQLNKQDAKTEVSEKTGAEQAVIFTHGFEMELSGSYFQALEFLQHLESMSGFYWRALDYQVQAYPKAKIILQINTLSLEEDWIGV